MRNFHIGWHPIGNLAPCYVIAEIGHNHQGEKERAIRMIQAAAECGVQAVKFQKRDNRNLFTRSFYDSPYPNSLAPIGTYGGHRDFLELKGEDFVLLKKCADDLGLDFLVTPFDPQSVDFCRGLDIPAYKVASGDVTNTKLLAYIAKIGRPIFVSTGAATFAEVDRAYDCLRKVNSEFCFLHAVAAYPTPMDQLNLPRICLLKARYPDVPIGYSCHAPGTLSGSLARTLGAVVIEKHFTLDRSLRGTDHAFSLDPKELKSLVDELRKTDEALLPHDDRLRTIESAARKKMGKGIYASREIRAGVLLTSDDLCLKSPATDLPPYRLDDIYNRRLKRDLASDEPIRLDDLL